MPRTPGRRACSDTIPQEAGTHVLLVPKATSAVHIQSPCSPLWAPFWATCPKNPVLGAKCQSSRRFCYKFYYSSKKQNSYVQISLPVDKHPPVHALQWVKAAPCKSRQKLLLTFNGKVTVLFNTLFLLIHQYNCSSARDTNILFL